MKFVKLIVPGMAVLALAACSNEEAPVNNQPQGTGAVTIKIASPTMSRSEVAGNNQNVTVTPAEGTNVVITLEATTGSGSIELTKEQWETQKSVTFWNVEDPSKVTVSMNGGTASYTALASTGTMQEVEHVYAYGETSTITLTAETSNGVANNNYNTGGGKAESTYQMYEATVQLAIPVARLEVSGITHVDEGTACLYNKLTIAGVYLDNVIASTNFVAYSNGAFASATEAGTNYSFDGTHGTGTASPLRDAIAAGNSNFLAANAVWPATEGNVYGYNFFGCTNSNLPIFKIYFSESEAVNSAEPLPAPRYAMITKYIDAEGNEITAFEPGHIYRITEAKLADKNIIGDEGGNTLYGVEVTVTEAVWTVENITAEWAE